MYDHKSLLDRRREGQEFSLADINRALRDAGDLAPERSDRMDQAVSEETTRIRQSTNTSLVGEPKDGHQKTSWAGWSRYLDYQHEESK